MAVDLADYVDSLRREVTPLGSNLFAGVADTTLANYLADAFWEARLDGFLTKWTSDVDGVVSPVDALGSDITQAEVALIVLYAGIRILRNQILNTNTSFRAKAGPVEFEQQASATMLAEMLKQLRDRRDQIIQQAQEVGTTVAVFDAYSTRSLQWSSYWGGPELVG